MFQLQASCDQDMEVLSPQLIGRHDSLCCLSPPKALPESVLQIGSGNSQFRPKCHCRDYTQVPEKEAIHMICMRPKEFLDAQASLAPSHVCLSVCWSVRNTF